MIGSKLGAVIVMAVAGTDRHYAIQYCRGLENTGFQQGDFNFTEMLKGEK